MNDKISAAIKQVSEELSKLSPDEFKAEFEKHVNGDIAGIMREVLGRGECLWSRADDDTDLWETSCDQAFCLTDGTPKANDFKFCCYCGKEIIEDSDCVPEE